MARAFLIALLALAMGAELCQGLKANWFGKKKSSTMSPELAAYVRAWVANRTTTPSPTADSKDALCKCLNWQETYKTKKVRCGMGAELYPYTAGLNRQSAIAPFMRLQDQEYCLNPPLKSNVAFYPKQNHAYCVRVNRNDGPLRDSGSWCYVSEHCQASNTFPLAKNATARAKFCKAGEDTSLGDLMPSSLFEFARRQETDLDKMLFMSYRPSFRKYEEGLKLKLFRAKYPDINGTYFFASNQTPGATRITFENQMWHMFPNGTQWPACLEGCEFHPQLWR